MAFFKTKVNLNIRPEHRRMAYEIAQKYPLRYESASQVWRAAIIRMYNEEIRNKPLEFNRSKKQNDCSIKENEVEK